MTRGIRKGLTQESVLNAAFAIVDADGPEALTMRRLAAAQGVAAMALYNHFADRDAILDALADRAFAIPVPTPGPVRRSRPSIPRWRERIAAIVLGVRDLAIGHPHIYRLSITRPTKPESALRLISHAMSALREAGLTDAQAVAAYHALVMMMQGFPFWLESMRSHCGPNAVSPPALGRALAADRQFSTDWRLVHGADPDRTFVQALNLVLDAIAQAARKKPSSRGLAAKRPRPRKK